MLRHIVSRDLGLLRHLRGHRAGRLGLFFVPGETVFVAAAIAAPSVVSSSGHRPVPLSALRQADRLHRPLRDAAARVGVISGRRERDVLAPLCARQRRGDPGLGLDLRARRCTGSGRHRARCWNGAASGFSYSSASSWSPAGSISAAMRTLWKSDPKRLPGPLRARPVGSQGAQAAKTTPLKA